MNSKQLAMCLPSSSRISFVFYGLLVIFLNLAIISSSYGENETDYQALLKIKSMITSQDPYGPLTSWNSSFHFCDWSGVTCGKRHRRVTSLQLRSLGLKGTLSPHVGNLSFLRELSLFNNSFQGAIPHEIGRLSRLRFFHLTQNEFDSTIPSNLSRCSNLQGLWLGYNKLVGSIPTEFINLSKLAILVVEYNNLTRGIPPFLGNITSLVTVSFTRNPLGGRIPDTLGHWKFLEQFYCGSCNLYGNIPHSLFNNSLLTDFSLATNKLTGSLPSNIGIMLPQLTYVQLRTNKLSGLFPSSISNCSRLQYLEIDQNMFSGMLTIDFSRLRDITWLTLGYNLFTSKDGDEMKFISSLKNCTSLKILVLRHCSFQGVLPKSIGNLSDQLQYIDLRENQLHGNIPLSFGNLVGLTYIHLESNQFTGSIPSTIGKLQQLQEFFLSENKLSGPIPDSIGNLSMLITLSVYSNMLEGNIPPSLGNCHHLSALDLQDNKLNGTIPTQLLQLSSLTIALYLSQNNLYGSLPAEIGELKMLSDLELFDNKLSGDIPSSLGSCKGLTSLSLRGNLFQGMIPPSLSSLSGLVELDLSHNNLSGQIPLFLEKFSLTILDISFNDFDGEVPMVGVFINSSAFFFIGNNKLCGGIVELGLPKCKEKQKNKKKFPLFVIVILVMSTLITIICLVYAWCKKKTERQLSQSLRSERFLQVSYGQLLKATNGFSNECLIGIGGFSSVYKGILDNDDGLVAIKVLHLQNRGAERSFMRECQAWQNIRHRNLLKIITSCSSVDFQGNDFKALVYEFMPNGSLHDWLHCSANTCKLNLLQRINILMDVASALDYIHNHCQPTIIHGDLKPRNILLDGDMIAHVGDFGLARFYDTTSAQHSSTGIRGTIGYTAPEYGFGCEMTSSGDVYGFGILILEVITRKMPTDDIFNEGLSLHKYSSMALPDRVIDVIDSDILNLHHKDENVNSKKIEDCMASIIKIGVSCSMDSPLQRMNIKKVVHELKHIIDGLQIT